MKQMSGKKSFYSKKKAITRNWYKADPLGRR